MLKKQAIKQSYERILKLLYVWEWKKQSIVRALVKGFQLPISRLLRPQLKEGPDARGLVGTGSPKDAGSLVDRKSFI